MQTSANVSLKTLKNHSATASLPANCVPFLIFFKLNLEYDSFQNCQTLTFNMVVKFAFLRFRRLSMNSFNCGIFSKSDLAVLRVGTGTLPSNGSYSIYCR